MVPLPSVSLGLFAVTFSMAVAATEEMATSEYGPTYQFKYHVDDLMTMDYKTHEEIGENGQVRGSYTVREPNGNLRVVSYTAGDNRGFQAMVRVRPGETSTAMADILSAQQNAQDLGLEQNDAPLKIQLSTERRSSQLKQRAQRQSQLMGKEKNRTENDSSEHNSHRFIAMEMQPTPIYAQTFQGQLQIANQTGKGKKYLHQNTLKSITSTSWQGSNGELLHRERHFEKARENSTKPSKTGRQFKGLSNEPLQVTTFQPKTEIAQEYLSDSDNKGKRPHYGPFLGPLFLHVVPAHFGSEGSVNFRTAIPIKPAVQIAGEATTCISARSKIKSPNQSYDVKNN